MPSATRKKRIKDNIIHFLVVVIYMVLRIKIGRLEESIPGAEEVNEGVLLSSRWRMGHDTDVTTEKRNNPKHSQSTTHHCTSLVKVKDVDKE